MANQFQFNRTSHGVMQAVETTQTVLIETTCFHCGRKAKGSGRTIAQARSHFRRHVERWGVAQGGAMLPTHREVVLCPDCFDKAKAAGAGKQMLQTVTDNAQDAAARQSDLHDDSDSDPHCDRTGFDGR